MDPFESLPTEILEEIIFYTADFVGVESLLSVSLWVNRVFEAQPRRTMLELIKSNPITTMPEIQQHLRNIAIINNPATHLTTPESCLHLCTNNKIDDIPSDVPDVLPDQMATPEIFHIIHIAANIQRLACMCLYTMQQNFISAVANSLGAGASQRAAEPIVWIEEYRVHWALWHLQNYSAFRNAATYRWGWSKETIEKFGHSYTDCNDIPCILAELIWTVAAVLADFGLRPLYGHLAEREEKGKNEEEGDEEESWEAAWEYPNETPIPFFASLELPLHQDHDHYSDYPIWSSHPVPDSNSKIDKAWFRTPKYRLYPSQTAMFRSFASGYSWPRGFEQAWRNMRQIQPFRRIGLMLWNQWRMYSVGLQTAIRRDASVCTPDGDFVRGQDFRLSKYDMYSRWLALVGKPPPDVGENYENVGSTLARYINPR